MFGKTIWFHQDLRMALIERPAGFTVGAVEAGVLTLGGDVVGPLEHEGRVTLLDVTTQMPVGFLVEAGTVTEDEANELLGVIRTHPSD